VTNQERKMTTQPHHISIVSNGATSPRTSREPITDRDTGTSLLGNHRDPALVSSLGNIRIH